MTENGYAALQGATLPETNSERPCRVAQKKKNAKLKKETIHLFEKKFTQLFQV